MPAQAISLMRTLPAGKGEGDGDRDGVLEGVGEEVPVRVGDGD